MTPHPTRDLVLINAAGFLRSFGVGMMGVLLGIYLFRTGLTSFAILVIAVGLAGAALATVRKIYAKCFGMMVARDGIEPLTPAFSGLRSTI